MNGSVHTASGRLGENYPVLFRFGARLPQYRSDRTGWIKQSGKKCAG